MVSQLLWKKSAQITPDFLLEKWTVFAWMLCNFCVYLRIAFHYTVVNHLNNRTMYSLHDFFTLDRKPIEDPVIMALNIRGYARLYKKKLAKNRKNGKNSPKTTKTEKEWSKIKKTNGEKFLKKSFRIWWKS